MTVMTKNLFISQLVLFVLLISCSAANTPEVFFKKKAQDFENTGDMKSMLEIAGERKLVLLGEASHGTHEYYVWRDSISRALVKDYGFNFIAVEGDWASLYRLNAYVKNKPGAASSAKEVLENLDRWPMWMWGNEEVVGMIEWLKKHNDALSPENKVGFYGMDVYDEWRSKDEVLRLLEKHNPDLHGRVSDLYNCFAETGRDSWAYAQSVARGGQNCSDAVGEVVALIENSRDELSRLSDSEYFYLLQNAKVKFNAEKFYRKSVASRDASGWNSRARHMHQTVNELMAFYGDQAQGIVWAHNTHIGDARYTEMQAHGQENIGMLSRMHWGDENVFSIGFTTYRGHVIAAYGWELPQMRLRIDRAQQNSHEYLLNKADKEQYFLVFDDAFRNNEMMLEPRGNRAVGVVFNPANEPRQYVNTILPLRYDGLVFFRKTKELKPLR